MGPSLAREVDSLMLRCHLGPSSASFGWTPLLCRVLADLCVCAQYVHYYFPKLLFRLFLLGCLLVGVGGLLPCAWLGLR